MNPSFWAMQKGMWKAFVSEFGQSTKSAQPNTGQVVYRSDMVVEAEAAQTTNAGIRDMYPK